MKLRLLAGAILCIFALAGLAAPATAAEYPPGLMFSTVLNGVKLLPKSGQFRLDNIQAVFLPDPNSSTYRPYDPDGGGKIWAILSETGSGKLFRFDFYGEKMTSPYWLLSSYKATDLVAGADAGVGWIDLAKPGNYLLEFFLESGKFYEYPFSVSTLGSDDPFDGEDLWFIDGAWEDWGYFFYNDANPDQSLHFKVWLRNYEHAKNKDVKPMIKVFRGGKVVCTSRPHRTLGLSPDWVRYTFDMIFEMEGTSGGGYFKAKDLLGTDGDYTLQLALGDDVYGKWPFSISGGKFVYTGRTVRGTADPLTFVEGGKDAFWYKKQ